MDTLQSLAHAKTLVDLNRHPDLQKWVEGQSAFAIHAVVEHALEREAWECLSVLFASKKCSKDLACSVLRQQVCANNTVAVQHLAATVDPFNTQTVDNRWVESAIHYCVKTNNQELLSILLDGSTKPRNPYIEDCDDYAALLVVAASHKNTEMFQYILTHKPNVLDDTNVYNLLRECVLNRSHGIIKILSPDYAEGMLNIAAEFNSIECLQLLKDYVSEAEFSTAILTYCAQQGDLKILELFDLDKNTMQWGSQHVYAIVEGANLELFHQVVPHKCAYALVPADYSCLFNHTDEEQILVFLKWMVTQVDPKMDDSYAITRAIHQKKWKAFELLLPLSDLNMLPNHVIAEIGDCSNPQLVDRVCAVVGNHIKQDIFEEAASNNNVVLLQHLIEQVNPKYNRSSALERACSNEHVEAATFLLPHSDVTAHDFSILQMIGQNRVVFSPALLLEAVNLVPCDQHSNFMEWLHTRARAPAREAIEHALSTIQNQTLHAHVSATPALKKRKM